MQFSSPIDFLTLLVDKEYPFITRSIIRDASKTMEAAADQTKLLDGIIHTVPIPIVVYDTNLKITNTNIPFGDIHSIIPLSLRYDSINDYGIRIEI